jgi:hypothetical protein
MTGKEKRLKVIVSYSAKDTYYLPIEAKTYRRLDTDDEDWNIYDAIEAYLNDHECKPAKEEGDDWQVSCYKEV